jgi:hypothetical protein
MDRQPAIEILSSEFLASIPFQGNSFGIAQGGTFRPHLIQHSSGRLAQAYVDSSNELQWMFTDTERNQWTTVDLSAITTDADYVTAVELANGNIGLVYLTSYTGDKVLRQATITVQGVVVTSESTIEDLNNSYEYSVPYVTRLASGDYYLVYVQKDSTTPLYTIYARTASTWGSWGSASDITPSGVDTSAEIDNPSLFETTEGDLFLLFDHVTSTQDDVTIKNIFSSISTDDGASFGAASARTSYTAFGSNGLDPIMVQKQNGTTWLIFYESINVLHMDSSATGFLQCRNYGMGVKDLHCDYVNQKILVTYGNSQFGTKYVTGVAVVDMATWSIDKIYYNGSTPALNQIFCDSHVWNHSRIHGDGKYLAMNCWGGDHTVVAVIDHTTDSITHYCIDDLSMTDGGLTDGIPAYSLPRNVEINSNARYGFLGIEPSCIRVDASRDRLYIGWDGGYYRQYHMFSYIDLTEAPDGEGFYDMNWITSETSGISVPGQNRVWYEYGWQFEIDTERQYLVAYHAGGGSVSGTSWNGGVSIHAENADAALVSYYTIHNNNSMCLWGPRQATIYNGAIYGDFYYRSAFPYTDQRGLIKIDYLTDTITYHRPSFVTADTHYFYDYAIDEVGGQLYMASGWGIARFDLVSGAWAIFQNATLPGFTRSGESNAMGFVAWDPTGANVIMGSWNDYVTNYLTGIGMFSENGAYNQLQYINADKAASWVWGSQHDLSYYSNEAYPTAVISPDNTLWAVWNHIDWEAGQNVLYWDNDLGEIDVVDDLIGSVTLNWQLKRVNKLDFKLGNGYLYDPQNLLSTKNVVGQKGRKVHVRIGEHIGGFTYWVNQGTYIVDTIKMSYKRGDEPVLTLSCTGKTSLWRHQQVAVSTLYSGGMPDDVIRDLLDDHTTWLSGDYNIPVFSNEHSIYYQWIDKTLWEIIEELCDHFFYAMFEDADGVFTVRPVSLTQSVDHEYSDQTKVQNFSPDDNYSDYTNRVRVIGESNDYTEVLHDEEMIAARSGTVGWWTKKSDEDVYYSEDGERQCRNPRLEVIHSPEEYGLLLDQLASGDGGIEMIYVDPYEKYVTVEIQVKDLTAAFVGAVIAMLAAAASAWGCDYCGPWIVAVAIASSLVMYILAAMANYQYEIWARPLGRVKTTIQYEANDVEFQQKLNGEIITEEITDPLCNSVTECRRVAEGNIEMIKAQRSRIQFTKLGHLQDELLDKLKVYHPYSNEGMELLVVGLKRTYTKGQGVFDEIDGWRYIP